MPEGDALHRAAARLQVLVGERLEVETPHPRAAATGIAPRLDGRVLESVDAYGKHLVLRFEGGLVLRSHLRMNGRWRVERRGAARTGRPWLVLRGRAWEAVQWDGPVLSLDLRLLERLGPDVVADGFDVEAVLARARAADPTRRLGELLQDQRVVAGIGNMWMAEALWSARLSPWLPAGEATDDELRAALADARDAMRGALRSARRLRRVYRRAGRPCPRCGGTIRSRGLGEHNRTAYWCERCQRGGGPPSS